MAGRTDGLIKNFRAGAAVAAYRIVKFGAADIDVLPASAALDALIGVSVDIPAVLGERVDVALGGIAEVQYGGVVARGDNLTADAQGRAIKAAPGAGVSVATIGIAMVSGVANDVGSVLVVPGRWTG